MKRILFFLLFYLAMLQSSISQTQAQLDAFKASAPLFQNKYYKANVWDVQRSPANASAGVSWRLSSFSAPYDASASSTINWGTSNNRYLQFDLVKSSAGSYTDDVLGSGNTFNIILKLYESNGTFVKNLCTSGSFMGFGDKGFLFNQNNTYGTFFANDSYVTGGSVTYTPATGVLTKLSELSNYKYSPQLIKPSVSNTSFIYNGQQQGIAIAPNSTYTITGSTSAVNVGTYSATITLNDKMNDSWDDGTKDDVVIDWNITKATYDMSAAGWSYTESFTWDGTQKTVSVTGLPAGVTVNSYTGNSAIDVGSYTAIALLDYDENNYYEPVIPSLDWVIKAEYINLSIIKLWNNVLAVSNGQKYEDIRNASFQWYKDGVLLQGNQQYIRFEESIPVGSYKVEIVINGDVAVTLNYTIASADVAKAYPNPLQAGQSLVIEMGEIRPDYEQAQVLDLSGFPVQASVERQLSGYKISGLSPGTYLVRIFTSEQPVATLKIFVK